MPVLQPGDTIDIWVVEAALGSGGMGSVYRCHNRAATRILAAVKVLEGGLKRYPEAEARFIREAEILFQLDHPNIVKVRNIRTDADPPYLEMEFVAGESLDERMRRGPLTFGEAVQAIRQVAEALEYLHAKQIRHRDIKPANLLLQKDGRLKLVDFGLAVEADATRITQQGMAFGTVSYAPPEWITPEQLDPSKWDLYALGVVFYELLTGHLAFPVSGQGTARQQAMQVIVAKQDHPPLDPGEDYHEDVRALIADMTHPDAKQRLGEASEVVARMYALKPAPRRPTGVTLAPASASQMFADSAADTSGWSTSREESETADSTTTASRPALRVPVVPAIPATTPVTMPTPRFAPVALAFGGAGALALAGLFGSGIFLVVALGWWITLPPPLPVTRDLVVEITGLPDGADTDVSSSVGAPVRDGFRYTFARIEPGRVDLRWTVGDRCTVAACTTPETCAPWCATGSASVQVPAGVDPLVERVAAEAPAPREVRIGLPGLVGDPGPMRATLGSLVGGHDDLGLLFASVPPGSHALTVSVGTCAPESLGCGASCPVGCRSVVETVVVPIVGDPSPALLALEPPERAAAPVRQRSTGVVSIQRLAAWIEAHPDWAPGGRFAAPGGKYLTWWTRSDRATSGAPATGFSPKLADAFCRDQGTRVPGLADEPRAPPAGKFELRLGEKGKNFMIELDDKGEVRPFPVDWESTVVSIAVFRCVK